MYKISVPIMVNERFDKDAVLEALQKAGADYVFLSPPLNSAKKEVSDRYIHMLRDLVPFYQEKGFAVGVWIWSLWIGDLESDSIMDYVMVNHKGEPRANDTYLNNNTKISSGFLCPTSEKAVNIMTDYIKEIAALQPDIILFDDDLDYGTHMQSIGCYCDRHVKMISERLGYAISREELSRAVTSHKPNHVRDEWYALMGETLEGYAKDIRKAVDSVNPDIRFGLCSVMSNWCADGTTAEKLVKLFAGNTKPFMRLTGAPYWTPILGNAGWFDMGAENLQHVIEYSRMECALVEDKNIEIISEGDVYPRPRHKVPAQYLEIFDTALRAADCTNGIHKYMLDYTSKALHYETGYLDRHIKNKPVYDEIARVFKGKTAIGVRVYECLGKIPQADFTGIENPHAYAANLFFDRAVKMLSDNSIPTVYENNYGVGIAFGENARHLPAEAFENGLILDIRAARILMEQGIDVGIESIGDNLANNLLYFPKYDDVVVTGYGQTSAYEIKVKDGAKAVVYTENNGKRFVDAFHYCNDKGQKFLVYAFDGAFTSDTRYRNYYTQRQLCDSIEWLLNGKMAVKCLGNPDLYILAKKNEEGLAIGLWNIFADEILKPVIELGQEYHDAEFINCSGQLTGSTVELSDIPAFGFAFINLH